MWPLLFQQYHRFLVLVASLAIHLVFLLASKFSHRHFRRSKQIDANHLKQMHHCIVALDQMQSSLDKTVVWILFSIHEFNEFEECLSLGLFGFEEIVFNLHLEYHAAKSALEHKQILNRLQVHFLHCGRLPFDKGPALFWPMLAWVSGDSCRPCEPFRLISYYVGSSTIFSFILVRHSRKLLLRIVQTGQVNLLGAVVLCGIDWGNLIGKPCKSLYSS